MGTRSASGVRIHGQDKLSYNHFDGYPSGVGDEIAKELQERFAGREYDDVIGELKQKAHSLRLIDESSAPSEADIRKATRDGSVDVSVAGQGVQDWYCLLRGHHGSILKRLDFGIAADSNDFVYDSLFCEWAYVLNFDTETLEVYEGFRRAKHKLGRYGEAKSRAKKARDDYAPVALAAVYPLRQVIAAGRITDPSHKEKDTLLPVEPVAEVV